jgi:hypothetical protein
MSYQKLSSHSSDDFFLDGLNLVARQYRNISTFNLNETNLKKFKSLFGVSPQLASILWERVFCQYPPCTDVLLFPVHLLWSLMFMKTYANETVLASYIGKDAKTVRKYNWIILEHISSSVHRHVRIIYLKYFVYIILFQPYFSFCF